MAWRMFWREWSWLILTFPRGYFRDGNEDNHENLVEFSLGIVPPPPQMLFFKKLMLYVTFLAHNLRILC